MSPELIAKNYNHSNKPGGMPFGHYTPCFFHSATGVRLNYSYYNLAAHQWNKYTGNIDYLFYDKTVHVSLRILNEFLYVSFKKGKTFNNYITMNELQ